MSVINATAIELLKKKHASEKSAFTKECKAALLEEEQSGATNEKLLALVADQAEFKASMLARHADELAALSITINKPSSLLFDELMDLGEKEYTFDSFAKAYPTFKDKAGSANRASGLEMMGFLFFESTKIREYETSNGVISVLSYVHPKRGEIRGEFILPISGEISKKTIYASLERLAMQYITAMRKEAKIAGAAVQPAKRTVLGTFS